MPAAKERPQEYPIEDVIENIGTTNLTAIIRHQRKIQEIGEFQSSPIPSTVTLSDDKLQLLRNNSSLYEDTLEDRIFADDILVALVAERATHPDSPNLIEAVRIRRTILAAEFMLSAMDIETIEPVATEPHNPAA